MILVLDNYDSFVHNLARYVKLCGYNAIVIRNDEINIKQIEKLKAEKIILSPGPCTPDTAGITLELVEHFYTNTPILGVCLGHQAIAQVFGSKITKAKCPMHGMSSWISHENTGILANLPNPLQVGRYHSLIVDQISPDSQLVTTAISTEGEIMALQHNQYPVYGVQFHPESILTAEGITIIRNFLSLI
ncbi:MAG: pabA [Burkholderiales bacterium]|jgi:anthranilate synthase/aminodeoxychorismate synthase-like glutamine amidotransferase|nr:pabA [Burkholderiales bacterium]